MCHCLECQRRTGSVFGVAAWYPRGQMELIRGTAKRFTRIADSGNKVAFNFCPDCGGTVFWEAEFRPGLVAVAVGAFADPDFEAPRHSVWDRWRHPWLLNFGKLEMEHTD
jgi:hypothetical protein